MPIIEPHDPHLPLAQGDVLQGISLFVRDLHTRIFRAFATLGFDDHGWMSTQDEVDSAWPSLRILA
jgi:hypothetical protein